MRSDQSSSHGSAGLQGELWGARAEAWAEHEPQSTPIFEAVLDLAGVGTGTRLLDLGCGTGTLCRLAADRGAKVAGLDASAALLEIARRRVPEADFRVGDLQLLPFASGDVDVVTAVNSLQFADDPVAALREAGRVAGPNGKVAIAVWGSPEEVALFTVMRSVAALVSGPPTRRPLLEPEGLERAIAEAGLTIHATRDGRSALVFGDRSEMLRQMTSAGGTVRIAREVGDRAVEGALVEAMAQFETEDGGYRLENAWRVVVALPAG